MKSALSLGGHTLKFLFAAGFSIVSDDHDISSRRIKVEVAENRVQRIHRGIKKHRGRLDILRDYAIPGEVVLDYLVKLFGEQLKRHKGTAICIDQDHIVEAR